MGKRSLRRGWRHLLTGGVGVLSVVPVLVCHTPASAFRLYDGEQFQASLDTTLSWGAQWRVQKRDEDLVGLGEGGKAFTANGDDGNLNYDRGLVSNAAKITSELELSSKHFGGFVRGSAFYDYENMKRDRERTQLTDEAKDLIGRDIDLLDAYVWSGFDIGSMPFQIRVGDQVVNWGESTFIGNSINSVNPIDVSKIRVPGAELREALVPEGMVWASVSMSENTSLEGLYLYDWEETRIDPLGTYFSTSDSLAPGGFKIVTGYGGLPDNLNASAADTMGAVPRGGDDEADDQGQFGVAFRLFAPALHDTEFSFYYLNYHSRLPILSLQTGSAEGLAAVAGGDVDGWWKTTRYRAEYPEDIQLFGAGFNTQWGGISWQGEVSHRRDMPLQIDGSELFFAVLGQIDPRFAAGNQVGDFSGGVEEKVQGYILRDVTQVQATFTKLLGPLLGAGSGVVLGEVGYTRVHNMPDKSDLRLSASGVTTSGNETLADLAHAGKPTESDDHFADANSWGYRLLGKLTFSNVIGPVSLSPRVAWSHDVSGNTPGPGGAFLEGRKAITVGLDGDYQGAWSADISYTNYFGAGRHNVINDRDFIGCNIKYSF